jgi:diacylglycerol O-acyltransferase
MITYAGRLTVGVTGDLDALPDVDRLVDAVRQELSDVVHPGND